MPQSTPSSIFSQSPTPTKDNRKRVPLVDRLLAKVEYTVDGCWLWTGSRSSNGAGQISAPGGRDGPVLVHRASYEIYIGPIPANGRVVQTCENKLCFCPAHLELATPKRQSVVRKVKWSRECPECGRVLTSRHFTRNLARPDGKTPWCRDCGRKKRADAWSVSLENFRRDWQGRQCWYCGISPTKKNHSVDHVVPIASGGSDETSNLVHCCRSCNCSKRSMSVEEWRELRERHRDKAPWFSPPQLRYLKRVGIELPKGEPYLFWFEKEQEAA